MAPDRSCGKALSRETVSTIGAQRTENYALQPMSKAAFIRMVTADQPEAPAYFAYDAEMNSRERPTLDATLARELHPLSMAAVLEQQASGVTAARHARPGRLRRRRTSPAASTSVWLVNTRPGLERCSTERGRSC